MDTDGLTQLPDEVCVEKFLGWETVDLNELASYSVHTVADLLEVFSNVASARPLMVRNVVIVIPEQFYHPVRVAGR